MDGFNEEGGFTSATTLSGIHWDIFVPWSVAKDGIKQEKGRDTDDREELKGWLNVNYIRFTDMVMALNGEQKASECPDDDRVIGECKGRSGAQFVD